MTPWRVLNTPLLTKQVEEKRASYHDLPFGKQHCAKKKEKLALY
jgi:hypothetical protein